MAKTVVGSFDSYVEAQGVVRELVSRGIEREDISVMARDQGGATTGATPAGSATTPDDTDGAGTGAAKGALAGGALGGVAGLAAGLAGLAIPGIGPIIAAGPIAAALAGAGVGAVAGGAIGALTNVGVSEEDAHYYAENVRRGGAVVVVNADDDEAEAVAQILQEHGAVDIDRRGEEWRQSGWTGFDATREPAESIPEARGATERPAVSATSAAAMTAAGEGIASPTAAGAMPGTPPAHLAQDTARTSAGSDETVIPVVREELKVGKREIERGRVRVYGRVIEEPVREHVTLREEHVRVERRAVDRPAAAQDIAAADTSLRLKETAEEPVVQKEARVVEEVAVNKDVRTRTEEIEDTVRRTEVNVENEGRDRGTTRSSDKPRG